jgi:hypothetical protein
MTNKESWARLLHEFTQRNAGRRARLEHDDPELGAQWQEVDYPLLGVAYDPRDDRVEIMVGFMGDTEQHLTHSISGASELEVFQPATGHGEVLRVGHGGVQTLLLLD